MKFFNGKCNLKNETTALKSLESFEFKVESLGTAYKELFVTGKISCIENYQAIVWAGSFAPSLIIHCKLTLSDIRGYDGNYISKKI